tara:strand:- start:786 stop:977 length:192 start_codon:yes stop_codon:yes gene_type:complete
MSISHHLTVFPHEEIWFDRMASAPCVDRRSGYAPSSVECRVGALGSCSVGMEEDDTFYTEISE